MKHAMRERCHATCCGVPCGGGTGLTARTHRLLKVRLPGLVQLAASRPGAGTPGAKTESKGVGVEHAYTPTSDPANSYPGPPCVFHRRHEASPVAFGAVNAFGTAPAFAPVAPPNVHACVGSPATQGCMLSAAGKGCDMVAHSEPSALVTVEGATTSCC